ncbi:MAG: DUF3253 domain-containing protein [Pseudomonadota bacterium]
MTRAKDFPSNDLIATTILRLCEERGLGKTICPSEAARELATSEAEWRALMPDVRRVAHGLALAGDIRATFRGQVVDAVTAKGPIRLGLAPGKAPE